MITKTTTVGMTEEQWHAERRKSIGGSDAGTILGLNKYSSPYALWAEKTGRVTPEDISDREAVRLGHDLEDYVAKRFAEATGKRVRRENHFLVIRHLIRYLLAIFTKHYDLSRISQLQLGCNVTHRNFNHFTCALQRQRIGHCNRH